MKKVTLAFPSYELLWTFKEKTKAINVTVKPRNNLMSGLFQPQEIEMATKEFKANTVQERV